MTPGAVMVLVKGMILDRSAVETSLNDSPPWTSYDLSKERLVEVSGDAAAVVSKAEAWRDGDRDPFIALMSSIYRAIEGEPRLALYQQTTITH